MPNTNTNQIRLTVEGKFPTIVSSSLEEIKFGVALTIDEDATEKEVMENFDIASGALRKHLQEKINLKKRQQ